MTNNGPITVSFIQKGVDADKARIATEQITKAARAEVVARTEVENANYRLNAATEAMKASEIAYQEGLAKGAGNRDALRKAHSEAVARFRDADRKAVVAADELSKATAALAGLRSLAKAITNGDELKAAIKDAKTPEDRKACVEAAEKMKLMFFLPKGWKAEADKMVTKATFTPAERAAFAEAEKKALEIQDDEPAKAMEILNNIADAYAREAGAAKQAGDIKSYSALALEGGRIRYLASCVRIQGFNERDLVQDVKDIPTETLAHHPIDKRQFSAERRDALAEKGQAMPDGSYPIVSKGDLQNAISSIGRAKDYDAVKAHIIARAEDLKATDLLPEAWVSTKKSVRKEMYMDEIAVCCPACFGKGCDHCDGGFCSPAEWEAIYSGEEANEEPGMDFTTKSLLTRSFEKSAAFQEYIFTKGGPGSGAQPGHAFNGNQYTGGMRSHPRLGITRGWKQTVSKYTEQLGAAKSAAEAAKSQAAFHEAAGRFGKAAEHMRQAADAHKTAAGLHEGVASTHRKEKEAGTPGDHDTIIRENRAEAAKQRVYQSRAAAEADRLSAMAG